VEEKEAHCCWWECKLAQPLWKTVWRFLKKLKLELPYDPASSLLGINRKEMRSVLQRDICTPMLIAALFITAKTWNVPGSLLQGHPIQVLFLLPQGHQGRVLLPKYGI
jgi:hypothetical protein